MSTLEQKAMEVYLVTYTYDDEFELVGICKTLDRAYELIESDLKLRNEREIERHENYCDSMSTSLISIPESDFPELNLRTKQEYDISIEKVL